MDSPTVLKRRLGSELRKMREGEKLTGAQVAKALGWSESKVSRIESGKSPLSDKDAKALLELYGITEVQDVRQFVALVRRSRQAGWWHSYGDSLPGWFKAYVGFEDDASQIRGWEPESVPGLLQTEDYARAVIRAGNPDLSSDEIDRRAAARAQRQQILDRSVPPKAWYVLSEAVLHRVVGSREIMRKQLERLAAAVDNYPHVTVQVLSFEAGAHGSMGYNFTLLSYSDVPGSIVYSEDGTSAMYLDKESDLSHYDESFTRLMASATSPERSVAWIKERAERYGKRD